MAVEPPYDPNAEAVHQTVAQPPQSTDIVPLDVQTIGQGGGLVGGVIALVFVLNKLWTVMKADRLDMGSSEKIASAHTSLIDTYRSEVERLLGRVVALDTALEAARVEQTKLTVELAETRHKLADCQEDLDVYKTTIDSR